MEHQETSPQEYRNAETPKYLFGVGSGYRRWSCERDEIAQR
jgi:hypothetical protein